MWLELSKAERKKAVDSELRADLAALQAVVWTFPTEGAGSPQKF